METDSIIPALIQFAVAYKWWFFALLPFGIAVMVLKTMSPR